MDVLTSATLIDLECPVPPAREPSEQGGSALALGGEADL
jgi:hypothetical protein